MPNYHFGNLLFQLVFVDEALHLDIPCNIVLANARILIEQGLWLLWTASTSLSVSRVGIGAIQRLMPLTEADTRSATCEQALGLLLLRNCQPQILYRKLLHI